MFGRLKRGGWPYSQPPNVPFEVNWNSPQAKGLVPWWPIFDSRGRTTDVLDKLKRFDLTQFNTPAWVASSMFGPTLHFDDAGAEYLGIQSGIVSGYPLTVSAWIYHAEADNDVAVYLGDNFNVHYHRLFVRNTHAIDYRAKDAGGLQVATTTSAGAIDTWMHGCIVGRSATDRAVFFNGGSKGTNAVACTPNAPVRTRVASDATGGTCFNGCIADIRVYNVAKTDAEVYQMYVNPWELYRPLTRRVWVLAPAAPPAGAMPMAMDHYRRRRV